MTTKIENGNFPLCKGGLRGISNPSLSPFSKGRGWVNSIIHLYCVCVLVGQSQLYNVMTNRPFTEFILSANEGLWVTDVRSIILNEVKSLNNEVR